MSTEGLTPVDSFRQKAAVCFEIENRVVEIVLGDDEDILGGLIDSPEAIESMSPTEFFVYRATAEEQSLAQSNRKCIETILQETPETIDLFKSMLESPELNPELTLTLGDIFANSKTPISDIIASDISDTFFGMVGEQAMQSLDLNYTNRLINAYLDETGFLRGQLNISDEVSEYQTKAINEATWRNREIVTAMLTGPISHLAIDHMVEVSLVPTDHDYESIILAMADTRTETDLTLLLRHRPLKKLISGGFTESIVSDRFTVLDNQLVTSTHKSTVTFDSPTRPRSYEPKRSGLVPVKPEQESFILGCLDSMLHSLRKLETMDADQLKALIEE